MGLVRALVDAFWVQCDSCKEFVNDQNYERTGQATTAAEDAGWTCRHPPAAGRNGEWLCPKCATTEGKAGV